MLKFLANDALGLKAKAISIKSERSLQIIDTNCNDGNSWFHVQTRLKAQR